MQNNDKTKELLTNLLQNLYDEQAVASSGTRDSYLVAGDGQYLGRITTNRLGTDSILNAYGPYGSPYSRTSIFNPYSPYGSQYGQFSLNNPYSTNPPKLYIDGRFKGVVSKNQFIPHRIPTDAFLYALHNNPIALLSGNILGSETQVRSLQRESFIEATDGTFLGSLKPNRLDQDSIFNTYGPYGNQFSQTSIFNLYGPYGGTFSNMSPFNQFTQTPPKIYHQGKMIGYLTVNPTFSNRIDPNEILDWSSKNISAI